MVVETNSWFFFFFFKDFIYLFMRNTERDRDRDRDRQRHRQRAKQAPRREPDVGLNPWSPGSGPGLKAVLNCCLLYTSDAADDVSWV